MSALRQQLIDAMLVRGFSPRTHKSYQAAISKTIVIDGVSAAGWVRFLLPSSHPEVSGPTTAVCGGLN